MILRSSGVMMITVTGLLTVFSLLVVWHDKTPGKLRTEELFPSMIAITESAPAITKLFSQLDLESPGPFYLVGIDASISWPVSATRACYRDPIAAAFTFRKTRDALSEEIAVYRYRSVEDFIRDLHDMELHSPGAMAETDMHSWVIVPVQPVDISLKLVVAAALILGALVITATLKKTS